MGQSKNVVDQRRSQTRHGPIKAGGQSKQPEWPINVIDSDQLPTGETARFRQPKAEIARFRLMVTERMDGG